MTVALYTHARCLAHDPGPGHPESPARLQAVLEALVQAYIFGTLALIYIASGMQSQVTNHPHQPDNGGEDK